MKIAMIKMIERRNPSITEQTNAKIEARTMRIVPQISLSKNLFTTITFLSLISFILQSQYLTKEL
ncbi:MAG: hypothetical protein WA091_03840 [Minisyncoccales bacterium]